MISKGSYSSVLIGFVAVLWLVGFSTTTASGVKVSPAKLQVKLGESAATSRLLVSNPTEEVLNFEVYETTAQEEVVAEPAEFALVPGREQVVLLSFKPGLRYKGRAEIAVVSISPNMQGSVGSGVKVPVEVLKSSGIDLYDPVFWLKLLEFIIVVLLVYRVSQRDWSKLFRKKVLI